MRKRILSILSVLCILLTLIPSTLAAGPGTGTLQIQNQTYQNGVLSFTAALSGTNGQLAVCVYGETGRLKNSAFYPAQSAVHVSFGSVSEVDSVKVAWLDDSFRLLAKPVSLKAGFGAAADYVQFTGELQRLLERYADTGGESVDSDNPYALARIIVRCDTLPDLSGKQVSAKIKGPDGIYVLQFQDSKRARECAEYLRTFPSVVYAVPDAVVQMEAPAAESLVRLAESGNHLSWGVDATGIGLYAEALKNKGVTGSVTVAVIDSGIDLNHPFLKGKYLPGYDFIENDSIPQDEAGHGTHVAGIISDCTDGLDVKILPIRVLNEDEKCPTLIWIANGIEYAIENGADVINLSLSAPIIENNYEHVDFAVRKALSKGITVVAAAGNQAGDTADRSPAHMQECITVSAINETNVLLPHSNCGDAVDLAAPGEHILSSVPVGKGIDYSDPNYDYKSGTSMAAPHVAAAAALLLLDRGKSQTPAQISETLRNAAQDLGGPGWDRKFGAGLLNLRPFIRPVITFQPNGGTGTMEPQNMDYGSTAVLRNNTFSRIGYTFTGWNTKADGSGKHYEDGGSLSTERNLTLYAQWEENAVAYAVLYSDGELVFQTTRTPASGRSTVQTYPVAALSGADGEYCGWYDQRSRIHKVTIAEKIQPKSTALWFYDCENLTAVNGLENLDTSSVTNMSQMFRNCGKLTELDLTWFDTSKVTNMMQMFQDCAVLKTIYASDRFTVIGVQSSQDMFNGCTMLVGGRGTSYTRTHTDKGYAKIDNGTSEPGYFRDKNAHDVLTLNYSDTTIYATEYDYIYLCSDDSLHQKLIVVDTGKSIQSGYSVQFYYSNAPGLQLHAYLNGEKISASSVEWRAEKSYGYGNVDENGYVSSYSNAGFITGLEASQMEQTITAVLKNNPSLTASVKITFVYDAKVRFAMENTDIATVDDEGVVYGKSEGETTLYMISDLTGKRVSCPVSVGKRESRSFDLTYRRENQFYSLDCYGGPEYISVSSFSDIYLGIPYDDELLYGSKLDVSIVSGPYTQNTSSVEWKNAVSISGKGIYYPLSSILQNYSGRILVYYQITLPDGQVLYSMGKDRDCFFLNLT